MLFFVSINIIAFFPPSDWRFVLTNCCYVYVLVVASCL